MIGNCLFWALIFKLIYGGELRSAHMAGKCRTWYLVRKDSSIIMFKRTHYILPPPIREWLYIGKIIVHSKETQSVPDTPKGLSIQGETLPTAQTASDAA